MLTLTRPWVGVNAYYLLAILGPQYIWWWNFEGLRVSFIVAVTTILGVCFQLMLGKAYNFNFLFNKQNVLLALLWLCIFCSYYFGRYVSHFASGGMGPTELFSLTNIIFLFYFIASVELNEISRLRFLLLVIIFSTGYLTFWANMQYFSGNWEAFNAGRLMGPISIDGGSIYRDENGFAMLFVTGAPFLYYYGHEVRNKWLRWCIWALIPLAWHAIFLTGSRGGLVGVGATLLSVLLNSKRKILAIPLLVSFLVFYQWQAGPTMSERSGAVVDYKEESAGMRIAAWKGGMLMLLDQPFFGVGLGSFITALPDYYPTEPRVAHNTFVQYAAESGIGAGLAYIAIIMTFFKQSVSIRRRCESDFNKDEMKTIDIYNNACTTSFVGLTVCSLFLSLNVYEIFFVLLLCNNALYHISLSLAHKCKNH